VERIQMVAVGGMVDLMVMEEAGMEMVQGGTEMEVLMETEEVGMEMATDGTETEV